MGFDTYKYVKDLMHKGAKEPLAESIVQIVSASRELDMSKLATKDQLESLQKQYEKFEHNVEKAFAKVDERFVRLEQKFEERSVRPEYKFEDSFIRLEEKFDTNLHWLIGIGGTAIGLIISTIGLLINVVMKMH
jgi:hypothetical protein